MLIRTTYRYLGLRQYSQSQQSAIKSKYDAVVIGGGHNGLVSAAYLAQAGKSVCVLEKRHVLGGAAVTEQIIPGYKFSRCSYVLSLLRPQIMSELELKKYGLKVYLRDPNSYTPMLEDLLPSTGRPRSLLIGSDHNLTHQQIAQFSKSDARAYPVYGEKLTALVDSLQPLLDSQPPDITKFVSGGLRGLWAEWSNVKPLILAGKKLGGDIPYFYELISAPATKILNRWFESEPLRATLATDAVTGAMVSPHQTGSSYVLLHHVMGELEGRRGAWGFVEGGMGALSECIAKSAKDKGAEIYAEQPVSSIQTSSGGRVTGVVLENGQEIQADMVLSNATAKLTFLKLMQENQLPKEYVDEVRSIDYASPVTKINVAVNKLPSFTASPNAADNKPLPHHECTIHLNCENTDLIHQAYLAAQKGEWFDKPFIEMTIPSSKDPTLAPEGHHVVQLFTMYTPYQLSGGREWNDETMKQYVDCVFDSIEKYCPGFKESVVGVDILPPPELERIFGLTGGNIFHGAMSLDQLYVNRPTPKYSGSRTPIQGLYLCGSGAHPGGGVMGSPGRLAALLALHQK